MTDPTPSQAPDEAGVVERPWPWEQRQPIADHARFFGRKPYVPLELAEAQLQWWQKRDFESGGRIAELERQLVALSPPPVVEETGYECRFETVPGDEGDITACQHCGLIHAPTPPAGAAVHCKDCGKNDVLCGGVDTKRLVI